jgi:hypothetical protein
MRTRSVSGIMRNLIEKFVWTTSWEAKYEFT